MVGSVKPPGKVDDDPCSAFVAVGCDDLTVVLADDAPDVGEAETGAQSFAADERFEGVIEDFGSEPDPGVLDRDLQTRRSGQRRAPRGQDNADVSPSGMASRAFINRLSRA